MVFQPHLYAQDAAIFPGRIAEALSLCDEVLLLPIYPAPRSRSKGWLPGILLPADRLSGTGESRGRKDLTDVLEIRRRPGNRW